MVMEKVKLRDGIRLAMAISADGNKFLQDSKPWAVVKEDKDTCASLVTAGERWGGRWAVVKEDNKDTCASLVTAGESRAEVAGRLPPVSMHASVNLLGPPPLIRFFPTRNRAELHHLSIHVC